jgi:hypothetical protein
MFVVRAFFWTMLWLCVCGLDVPAVGVFLRSGPSDHSAFFWVESESTVQLYPVGEVSLVDLCNVAPPCYDYLESSSTCVGITPTCNCLVWTPTIDWNGTTIVIKEMKSAWPQCTRFFIKGNGTLSIYWRLAAVGVALPSIVRDVGFMLWAGSSIGRALTYEQFMFGFVLPKSCNHLAVTPTCLSRTGVLVQQISGNRVHTGPDVVYAWAMGIIASVFLIAEVLFAKRTSIHKSLKLKKTK